jgi:hypothetical protein
MTNRELTTDETAAADDDLDPHAADGWEVLVGHDPGLWIALPARWPHQGHGTARSWIAATVRDVVARTAAPTRAGKKWLVKVLDRLSTWQTPNELKFLYLPSLSSELSLLRIQFGLADGDRDETLRGLVLESDLPSLEPPVLETVTTDSLGVGVHGIRHAELDGDLMVTSVFAFRSGPFDLRVTCEIGPPELAPTLALVVRDFVDGISVVRVA